MIRALGDLPSDLGLEAVDKFSMANLDTVRSKTGFMVRTALPPGTHAASPGTAVLLLMFGVDKQKRRGGIAEVKAAS